MRNTHPLDGFPDLDDWTRAVPRLEERVARLDGLKKGVEVEQFVPMSLSGRPGALGLFSDVQWRRQALALLLADWACYRTPQDRVDLIRLLYVAHAFPRGFRVFWLDSPALDAWYPVGYTGWYPVPEPTFKALEDGTIARGSVLPPPIPPPGRPFVYVFNYSIIAPLRGTACSKHLLTALAADLARDHAAGLAAITVSGDGSRIAEGLGMRKGEPALVAPGDEEEWIFHCRTP